MYLENIKKIEQVITNYFEGIYYGNPEKLESSFDDSETQID